MLLNTHETEAWWLERMMDKANMVTSYKAYWLMGIIDIITEEEKYILNFEEIVNRMIINAWFPVLKYKLSFGIQDRLTSLVKYLSEEYPYLKEYNKAKLLLTLENSNELKGDKSFQKLRSNLYQMVPFRLLTPFFREETRGIKDQKKNKLIKYLSSESYISFYHFSDDYKIVIRKNWMDYILKNQALIKGWIQYKLILYMQARNPNVPNIPLKLQVPNKRYLSSAQKFWKASAETGSIHDIYTGLELNAENYIKHGSLSIDHFIPWSFVLHDEFWNLTPSFKNINSKKSDRLPDLDTYLNDFCSLHVYAIKKIKETNQKKLLEDYYTISSRELNSILSDDIEVSRNALYESLEDTIKPLHQIALNQGFDMWHFLE